MRISKKKFPIVRPLNNPTGRDDQNEIEIELENCSIRC